MESILVAQNGVDKTEVNYASQSMKVAFHPDITEPSRLQKAAQSIGYDLIVHIATGKEKQE